ncbi:MAG TPA: hypothetical protein VK138_04090, partial [Acidiferrobacterales bacterium]|nr:hypothetical protein [Acidiferrobacterales bacterium]
FSFFFIFSITCMIEKMAALSALRFPAALESRGRPSVAGPLGGRKVHRTFLIIPPRPCAAGTSD